MKSVKIFGIVLGVAFLLILASTFIGGDKEKEAATVKVERTDFDVDLEIKGEIEAASSVTILLPDEFFNPRNRVSEIELSDLIPEGTHVKKGDYVATLDNSEVNSEIERIQEEIDKLQERYNVAILDTAVKLNEQRNKIEGVRFDLKEKEIALEQSVYESKAIQRKAEIDVEQTKRTLENESNRYKQMVAYEKNNIKWVSDRLEAYGDHKTFYETLRSKLTINAPHSGLLLYARAWRGQKIKTGTMLNRWSYRYRQVAVLPNLDSLLSVTYVNEIDIAKVYEGQEVFISIDALPEHTFKGVVTQVAKMGKKSRSDGSKVFQVDIYIDPDEEELKPSMTTTNQLMLKSLTDVLVLPINAIYSENNTSYVYQKQGLKIVKQEVEIGVQDDKLVEIKRGLNEGDRCLLKEPENLEKIEVIRL